MSRVASSRRAPYNSAIGNVTRTRVRRIAYAEAVRRSAVKYAAER